ncbi:MAG TPA: hypothetical protein DIC23_16385, partial [Planctomycetaceae bacterium]|nr:hypothetical protein [Planctomycetaceae bacterium]
SGRLHREPADLLETLLRVVRIAASHWGNILQDLYLGLALMTLVSVGTFGLGTRLARGHHWIGNGLAIATVLLTILYVRFFWDDIRLARFVPVSNLIIVGNGLPLMSTFLAGIVWRRIRHWRRLVAVTALWIAGLYAVASPLLANTPACSANWETIDDFGVRVCIQTTPATCTPACAATLLGLYGIDTTEAEMARLCLTSRNGTNWAGLYHGLKAKTRDTPWDVVVLSGSLKDLRGPVIISVGLPHDVAPDSYYRTKWIWNPGEEHSVILLGINQKGLLQIVDPAPEIRGETWFPQDLGVLWRGQGMALVRREATR